MQSLFLTQYLKSNMFVQDLHEKLANHDVNFDLIVSDINYNNLPLLSINPENKPKHVSLIDARKDAIFTSKHPLIILNELNISFTQPIHKLLNDKNYATIINIHTGLGSYGKKIYPEINDLDSIIDLNFNIFEPIDLENLRNIFKQNSKQYIRILHKEIPNAIFDVDELGIIDAKMLENLNSISLKTYGFTGNDGIILATGSLFAIAIQTGELLQNQNKQISIFILQNLNSQRNKEIIENIKKSKKLFILIDHKSSNKIKNQIEEKLKRLNITNTQINIINPKYENLTTILNEYQEEQSDFDPETLAQRIAAKL